MRSAAAPCPSSGPRTEKRTAVRGRLVRPPGVHRRPQVTSRRSEMKTAATLTTAM